jgi:hypothetical protein
MKNGLDDEIERRLRSVRLGPAPPGLREKVLGAAREAKTATAWTTPLLRKCLAGCAVIMAAAFVADTAASSRQNARFQALLGGTRAAETDQDREGEPEDKELRDVLGPNALHVEKGPLAQRTHMKKLSPAARPGLRSEAPWEDIDERKISENIN